MALPRSFDLVAALLGIWRAGAVYMPVDRALPAARRQRLLAEAEVAMMFITSDAAKNEVAEEGVDVVSTDRVLAASPIAPVGGVLAPDDPAYLIYTSGSSGRPKGVLNSHRGLEHSASPLPGSFGVDASDIVLQFLPPTFDAHLFEISLALSAGATLAVPPSPVLPDLSLAAFMAEQKVSVVAMTPSSLQALPEEADLPQLRVVVAGGEACTADVVRRWAPGRAFYNVYGPTEVALWTTVARVPDLDDPALIGSPAPGLNVDLVDDRGRPVPDGLPGEVVAVGPAVALGYLGQPNMTAAKFSGAGSQRRYHTGDLAVRRPDGLLTFIGRADRQVKLRGFRIELDEIERALQTHDGIGAAAVSLQGSGMYGTLTAYVTCSKSADGHEACRGGKPTVLAADVKRYLSETLPAYMIPHAIKVLDTLPLTAHGKVDHAVLVAAGPTPEVRSPEPHTAFPDPDEERVAAAWSEVLGRRPTEVDEDFFAVGGTSLGLVRVAALLERQLCRPVTVDRLIEARTLAGMAVSVRGTDRYGATPPAHLIRLFQKDEQPTWVVVHALAGTVAPYLELVKRVGTRACVGLACNSYAETSLRALGRRYAELVAGQVGADRPWVVTGWSLGGSIALEIARAAPAAGLKTPRVVMVDSPAPLKGRYSRRTDEQRLRRLLLAEPLDEELARAGATLFNDHRPEPFPGEVVLFMAEDRSCAEREDPLFDRSDGALGWSEICPNLSVVGVPGDHLSVMRSPVLAVVDTLRRVLRSERPSVSSSGLNDELSHSVRRHPQTSAYRPSSASGPRVEFASKRGPK